VTVVDTSLFIEAERRRAQVQARLRDLIAGAPFYRALFDAVPVIGADRRAAEMGAAIAGERERVGHCLQDTDAPIAGCPAAAGADPLVTADEDFAGTSHFEVEVVRPS